jgi:hypothetical protein
MMVWLRGGVRGGNVFVLNNAAGLVLLLAGVMAGGD